jgi:hypothetical protein
MLLTHYQEHSFLLFAVCFVSLTQRMNHVHRHVQIAGRKTTPRKMILNQIFCYLTSYVHNLVSSFLWA